MSLDDWILPIQVVVEGLVDEAIADRLLREIGIPGDRYIISVRGGRAKIMSKLQNYNYAASRQPWVIFMDLDNDECAPSLIARYLPSPNAGMCLRVAVREVESWIMADPTHLANFLGLSPSVVPTSPDAEEDPKLKLLQLARRSRRRDIREDLVVERNGTLREGPAYAGRLQRFVREEWDVQRAAERSDSLLRCIRGLQRWKQRVFLSSPTSPPSL
ncbi:hypothetical protein GCM10025857_27320 [Alicyclobacillus contaminans]|uniref:hypothetical protein n=1 Tax=Alicyclobacillus contaminans TaxID=392016 RepID=UPI0004027731|nr:hypothetical protein [Alicyclobacillus contaminans]GMA51375.1 hypothetical protein GCM10025857_27320 [Alicyclobacillus contaminans]